MADTQIANLTLGTLAANSKFPKQETAGVDGTHVLWSGMGGLVSTTGSDANVTMAVGTLYLVDMSSWATADRTYTLPATAAVGERCGVMVTGSNASYELLLTANSGDTLGGVAGGTTWGKMFISGELVVMECVSASATWQVVQDHRIPCIASFTGTQLMPAGSWQVFDFSAMTQQINRGSIVKTTTDTITSRRDAEVIVACGGYSQTATLSNNQELFLQVERDTGGGLTNYNPLNRMTSGATVQQLYGITTVVAAYQLDGYQFDVRLQHEGTATTTYDIACHVVEVLN